LLRSAARADYVLEELKRRRLGIIETPDEVDEAALARVHAPRYLDFLAGAWEEWVALDPAKGFMHAPADAAATGQGSARIAR
jgi:acetoin utilization deacetylase AcuC-like enzyme